VECAKSIPPTCVTVIIVKALCINDLCIYYLIPFFLSPETTPGHKKSNEADAIYEEHIKTDMICVSQFTGGKVDFIVSWVGSKVLEELAASMFSFHPENVCSRYPRNFIIPLKTTTPHILDYRLLIRSKISLNLFKNFVVLACLLCNISKRVAANDCDGRSCRGRYLVL
jgi:hypothetical protein